MYDGNGVLLEQESTFGYYSTHAGNLVKIDPDTGKATSKLVLDTDDGELPTEYDKILIFKEIEKKKILSIEVHNQINNFVVSRYDPKKGLTSTADFSIDRLTHLSVNQSMISDIANAAGYTLAVLRVDDAKTDDKGNLNLAEYGLAPEKRTKLVVDENGNIQLEEYNYEPSYYILTTTSGEKYKMLIGDRLINDGGYYAQYINIDKNGNETPRQKLYVLGNSIGTTLLANKKKFIVPGIAYPVTQSDYYDVTNFTINKKNSNGTYDTITAFSYVDIADRTGTVLGNHPYVFDDERSAAYHPNYDRIDNCLLSFMEPTIVDLVVLDPSNEDRAKYGLASVIVDDEGNPVLDEKGNKKYIYDSPYVVSFKRTTPADDGSKDEIQFLQTIYISEKPNSDNYYCYTTITLIDSDKKIEELSKNGLKLSMLCEVSGDTFNFLKYNEYDWTYPRILETGIKYATNVTIDSPDYWAKFDIKNEKNGEDYATSAIGSASNGKTADTFGMYTITDYTGKYTWVITQTDVRAYTVDGSTELKPADRMTGVNDIGEKIKYLTNPIVVNNGVINKIDVTVNEVKITYVNGTTKTYVRYQTMLFKKLYQSINSLSIVDHYELSAEEEAALIADPSKYIATITLTNDQNVTTTVKFYELTARKAYITVNGEGGYYVSTSAIQKIFDNSEKFFNCENIT